VMNVRDVLELLEWHALRLRASNKNQCIRFQQIIDSANSMNASWMSSRFS
jgi:hypothetical protein